MTRRKEKAYNNSFFFLSFHFLKNLTACPVIVGSKWVSNKWIHERGQEFIRPCALEPDHDMEF